MPGDSDKYLQIAREIIANLAKMQSSETKSEERFSLQQQTHELIREFRYKEDMGAAYDYLREHGPKVDYNSSPLATLDLHSYLVALHKIVEISVANHEGKASGVAAVSQSAGAIVDEIIVLKERLKSATTENEVTDIEQLLLEHIARLEVLYDNNQVLIKDVLSSKGEQENTKKLSDYRSTILETVLTRKAELGRVSKRLKKYQKDIKAIIAKCDALISVPDLEKLDEQETDIARLIAKLGVPAEFQQALCLYVDEQVGVISGQTVSEKLTAYLTQKASLQRQILIRAKIKLAADALLTAIEKFNPNVTDSNHKINSRAEGLMVQIAELRALYPNQELWLEAVSESLIEHGLQNNFTERAAVSGYLSAIIDKKLNAVYEQKAKAHIDLIFEKAQGALLTKETDKFESFKQQAMAEVERINDSRDSPIINQGHVIAAATAHFNDNRDTVSPKLQHIDKPPDDSNALKEEITKRLNALFQQKQNELAQARSKAEALSDEYLTIYNALFADDIDDTQIEALTQQLIVLNQKLETLDDSLEVRTLFRDNINQGIKDAPINEHEKLIGHIETTDALKGDVIVLNNHLVARAHQKLLEKQIKKAKAHVDGIFNEARNAIESDSQQAFEVSQREVFAQIALITDNPDSPVINKSPVVAVGVEYFNDNKTRVHENLAAIDDSPATASAFKDELQKRFTDLFAVKKQEFEQSRDEAEQLSQQFLENYRALFAEDVTDERIEALSDVIDTLLEQIAKLVDTDDIRALFSARVNEGIRLKPINESAHRVMAGDSLGALSDSVTVLNRHLVYRAKEALLKRQQQRAKEHLFRIGEELKQVEAQEDSIQLEALRQQTLDLIGKISDDHRVNPKEAVVIFARDAFNDKGFVDENLTDEVLTREALQQELRAILDKLYQRQLAIIADRKEANKVKPQPKPDIEEPTQVSRLHHFALFGDYAHDMPITIDGSYGIIDEHYLHEYGTQALFSDNQKKFFEVKCDRREVTPEIAAKLKDKGVTMQSNTGLHYVARISGDYLTLMMPQSEFVQCDQDTPAQSHERSLLTVVEMVNQLVANCRSIYLSGSSFERAVGRLYIEALEEASGGQINFKTVYPPLEYIEASSQYEKAKAFVDKLMSSDYGKNIEAKDFYISALNPSRGIDVASSSEVSRDNAPVNPHR